MARSDDDFLQLARDRFSQAQEADNGQRSRELEDLQTYAGNVWTAEELKARGAQPSEAGMPPIPARQSLSIPLLQEPVNKSSTICAPRNSVSRLCRSMTSPMAARVQTIAK